MQAARRRRRRKIGSRRRVVMRRQLRSPFQPHGAAPQLMLPV